MKQTLDTLVRGQEEILTSVGNVSKRLEIMAKNNSELNEVLLRKLEKIQDSLFVIEELLLERGMLLNQLRERFAGRGCRDFDGVGAVCVLPQGRGD